MIGVLPVGPVVASAPVRLLLLATTLGSASGALAIIRMRQCDHELTAYPARRVAGAAVLLSIAALSTALFVSSIG
ncbi:MAG TPA: hypothetical protein VHE36_05525 [Sphingomicrobium sp.]|jgi:hypothetical protein|nr:hypothetical protein [Sphingomicrobium sp.]